MATTASLTPGGDRPGGEATVGPLIDGFTPQPGQEFLILMLASLTGSFSAVELPPLPMGSFWYSSSLLVDGTLRVGLVPATYAEWRTGWGLPPIDAGDHDRDGIADVRQYHLGLDPTADSSGNAGLPRSWLVRRRGRRGRDWSSVCRSSGG